MVPNRGFHTFTVFYQVQPKLGTIVSQSLKRIRESSIIVYTCVTVYYNCIIANEVDRHRAVELTLCLLRKWRILFCSNRFSLHIRKFVRKRIVLFNCFLFLLLLFQFSLTNKH
jgi:hypothetical protein